MALIGDFLKAVEQMFSARFFWVVLKSLALTAALFLGISFGVAYILQVVLPDSFSIPFVGEIGFLDELFSFAAIPILLLLSSFVMFPVAALFIGFFLDEIAGAVERRHYPHLPPARSIPISELLIDGLQFSVVFVIANILALIIYLLVPPLSPIVFWLVNGYLLGREYFSQVALRRLPEAEAKALRRNNRGRVWLAGFLMAVPLSIPILNLLVPILGVATITHQFQRLR